MHNISGGKMNNLHRLDMQLRKIRKQKRNEQTVRSHKPIETKNDVEKRALVVLLIVLGC